MSREIKFRGKRIDNGEWGYGNLIVDVGGSAEIMSFDTNADGSRAYVDPKTIGQFTGLKDKDSVEIYEGDIINLLDEVGAVFFNTYTACFDIQYSGGDCDILCMLSGWEPEEAEVIGNIYEHKHHFHDPKNPQT